MRFDGNSYGKKTVTTQSDYLKSDRNENKVNEIK